MSLDVSLYIECSHCGISSYVYDRNITHNLTEMADKAGIYLACWRPEELNFTKAKDLIPLLEEGLNKLKNNPKKYKKYNPKNGLGSYEGLVAFVEEYLENCKKYPNSELRISR